MCSEKRFGSCGGRNASSARVSGGATRVEVPVALRATVVQALIIALVHTCITKIFVCISAFFSSQSTYDMNFTPNANITFELRPRPNIFLALGEPNRINTCLRQSASNGALLGRLRRAPLTSRWGPIANRGRIKIPACCRRQESFCRLELRQYFSVVVADCPPLALFCPLSSRSVFSWVSILFFGVFLERTWYLIYWQHLLAGSISRLSLPVFTINIILPVRCTDAPSNRLGD